VGSIEVNGTVMDTESEFQQLFSGRVDPVTGEFIPAKITDFDIVLNTETEKYESVLHKITITEQKNLWDGALVKMKDKDGNTYEVRLNDETLKNQVMDFVYTTKDPATGKDILIIEDGKIKSLLEKITIGSIEVNGEMLDGSAFKQLITNKVVDFNIVLNTESDKYESVLHQVTVQEQKTLWGDGVTIKVQDQAGKTHSIKLTSETLKNQVMDFVYRDDNGNLIIEDGKIQSLLKSMNIEETIIDGRLMANVDGQLVDAGAFKQVISDKSLSFDIVLNTESGKYESVLQKLSVGEQNTLWGDGITVKFKDQAGIEQTVKLTSETLKGQVMEFVYKNEKGELIIEDGKIQSLLSKMSVEEVSVDGRLMVKVGDQLIDAGAFKQLTSDKTISFDIVLNTESGKYENVLSKLTRNRVHTARKKLLEL